MRRGSLGLMAALAVLSAAASADAPRALDESDYARAERFLPYATAPLITGLVENPLWRPNGTLCYRTRSPSGTHFVLANTCLFRRCSGRLFTQRPMGFHQQQP